jgi:hypothetical protein
MADLMILRRSRDGEKDYDVLVANLHAARWNAAWVLQDEIGLTRLQAFQIGDGLAVDTPLESHGFTWTLVPW